MNTATRDELRQQHSALIAKLTRVREIARDSPHKLHDALLELANLLRWHQLREEEVLRELLPPREHWEVTRAVREHAEEHRHLYDMLLVLSTANDSTTVAASALALVDRILLHVQAETFVDE